MNNTLYTTTDEGSILDLTPEFMETFLFVINIIVTPIVCSAGLVGNFVGVCVLNRDPNKNKLSIFTYIIFLMMVDIIYLLSGLCETALGLLDIFDYYLGAFLNAYVGPYKGYLHMVLSHISATLVIYMSIEHFMAIAFPFNVKNSWIAKYPRSIIGLTCLVFIAYSSPFAISFQVTTFINDDNMTEYMSVINPDYVELFDNLLIVETILLQIIAPSTVLILGICIIVAHSKFLKRRSAIRNTQQQDQIKFTLMILCVATMYLLVSIPNLCLKFLMFTDSNYSFGGRYNMTVSFFLTLNDILALFNAAIDFFIYILVTGRYRIAALTTCNNVPCAVCLVAGEKSHETEHNNTTSSQTKSTNSEMDTCTSNPFDKM